MKRLSFYVIVVLMLFGLCSCHGKKTIIKEYEVPSEFDTSRNYEITFWSKNDSNNVQKAIYEDTIKRFETIYPNIKVTMVSESDYTKIYSNVIKNISTNTTPNVCITYPDHVAAYMKGDNVIVPLDKLADNPKYGLGGSEVKFDSVPRSEVVDKFLNECKINDELYALPFMRSSEALYINKDYVEKLGFTIPDVVTWDFVWEVSEKAMNEKTADQVLIPMIYKSTDNMLIQMCEQYGIPFTTSDADVLLFNDQLSDLLKELTVYKNKKLFDTFKRVSYPGNFYNAGQCIFAIDSTAGSTWLGSKAPLIEIDPSLIKDFETVVRPVPQKDAEDIKMISQGPSVCVFDKEDPQEVLASWLFTQFLLNDETQISYSKTEGYIPVTKTAINSPVYKEYLSKRDDSEEFYSVKIDCAKLVIDNIENTFITNVFNGSTLVRSAAGSMIEAIFKPQYGDASDEAIEKLYNDTKKLYKIDEIKINNGTNAKPSFEGEKLPGTAVALIVTLLSTWVILGGVFAYQKVKEKKLK